MVIKSWLLDRYVTYLGSRLEPIQKRPRLSTCLAVLPCLIYIWARDPSEPGVTPPCLILTFTGLYCPGCGSLRALHQLLNGNVLAAFWLNPIMVISIPLVISALFLQIHPSKFLDNRLYRNITIGFCFAIVIPYWILRNTGIEQLPIPN